MARLESLKMFIKMITVEPTLFLTMLAIMLTTVVDQAFFIDKACRVNHMFNSTVCDEIASPTYKKNNQLVQVTVSNANLVKDILFSGCQCIVALFMGAWSDKRGRKVPLLIGLFGRLYYSIIMTLIALQDSWSVEYIIYLAALPTGLTGADVVIFAAAFTYLVDITNEQNRTMRITILEIVFFISFPIGISMGSYLFTTVANRSFSVMYGIYACIISLAIIYSWLRLDRYTDKKQFPLLEGDNILTDFFNVNHLLETGKTIFKHREKRKRTYLLLLLVMMLMFTFQRSENMVFYMYMQLVFNWTFEQISYLRTFVSTFQIFILLLVVPLINKVLKLRDTLIIAAGALGFLVGNALYSAADTNWLIYLGGAFTSFGPLCAPGIKSIVSKLVQGHEKGKAYSVLSIAENATPLIASTSYNQLYKATMKTAPEAIFYLTVVCQAVILIMVAFVHFRSNESDLTQKTDNDLKEKPTEIITAPASIIMEKP